MTREQLAGWPSDAQVEAAAKALAVAADEPFDQVSRRKYLLDARCALIAAAPDPAAIRRQAFEEAAKVADGHAEFRKNNDDFSTGYQVGEDIAQAIRALAQQPAKDWPWQLIETAPKDGTGFLACNGNWMTVCHWHTIGQMWCSSGPVYSKYPPDEQPTHWMPLPTPPTPTKQD